MEISNNINAVRTYANKLNDNAQELASKTFQNETTNATANTTQTSDENVGIERNLTDNISIENGFDAQIRSIDANNEILGSILDIKS